MSKLPQTKIPLNLISETPDKWVVVRITDQGGPGMMDPEYKVFATWTGGWTDSDRWRLNSGITKVVQEGDYYHFFGYSGSCYKCHVKDYGVMNSFGNTVLDKMIKAANGGGVNVEIMDKDSNWLGLKQDFK